MDRPERAVSGALTPNAPAPGLEAAVAEHLSPPALPAEVDADEVRQLAAAVRSHLAWLGEAGIGGVPMARARPRPLPSPASELDALSIELAPEPHPRPPISARRPAPAPEPTVAEHAEPPSPIDAVLEDLVRPKRSPSVSAPLPAAMPTPVADVAQAVYPELLQIAPRSGAAGLAQVRAVLGDCRRCKLCHGRQHLVFDDGAAEAVVAFVGEGPGADEDRLGRPFVGAAGELLDRMIDAMGAEARKRGLVELAPRLSRKAVYICNVVKCRPPGNRTPEPDEIAACSAFLRAQLASLPNLRVIVALGRTPAHYLLGTTAPISRLRGRFTSFEGIPLMPTYHPAYLLRTPSEKKQVWSDLQLVIEKLALPPSGSGLDATAERNLE